MCVYVCAWVRACFHFQFLLIIFRRDEHTKKHTRTHTRTHTHTPKHKRSNTQKRIHHTQKILNWWYTYTPWNIQAILKQYVELGAVTVAGACNLWTAGLSEVGTRVLRDNRTALISAQFRVPRRIRGAWRRTLFSKTSHCEMCFRIKF